MPITDLEAIIQKYGPEIEKRARRTERRFAAKAGEWGFGYRAVHWEDIQQRVYETIIKKGITLADIDNHPEPLGYIYKMCEHKALTEAKKARALSGTLALTGFRDEEDDPYGWVADKIPTPEAAPEQAVLGTEFDTRVRDIAAEVIGQLVGHAAEAIEAWVFDGQDAEGVARHLGTTYAAARQRISRALLTLSDDDRATLSAARAYFHPEAKRPKATEGTPTALLELTET